MLGRFGGPFHFRGSETMRARGVITVATVLALAGIGACSGSAAPPGREGNLGHGIFDYQCITDQDPACPEGTNTMPGCGGFASTTPTSTQCFPSAVAVGGRFRVQYSPNTDTTKVGNPTLKGVATDFLSSLGDGQFKAIKPGWVGVYSQSTVDSTLVDYTLVKVSAITRVQIVDVATKRGVPPGGVSLSTGGVAAYKINALDPNGQPLAGAVEGFLWETSDAKIISLNEDPHTAQMTVGALATGAATLTAYADDTKAVSTKLEIVVK
jgi:hypothetical protein